MRGTDHQQPDMFSYLSPEQRVRKDHPLRAVRAMTDEILHSISRLFDAMYAERGRPSIPPEKLLRAQLLQMLYSVRSERLKGFGPRMANGARRPTIPATRRRIFTARSVATRRMNRRLILMRSWRARARARRPS